MFLLAPFKEIIMAKNKHLTLDNRITIQEMLSKGESFKRIAAEIGKDPTTISKETRSRMHFQKTGCYGRVFNDCLIKKDCTLKHLCGDKHCKKQCCFCNKYSCSSFCSDYIKHVCPSLLKAPYVCNGCKSRNSCTLEKRIYKASLAQKEYEEILSETRTGLVVTEEESTKLDNLISPLLKKGQSLNHIYTNNKNNIQFHLRTLYNYVDKGIFSARNIDMPRTVRMGKRKKTKEHKIDSKCRLGRTYGDFQVFLQESPGASVVEMDSVIGKVGGKALLTLHFNVVGYMLAFLRDANNAESVHENINKLEYSIGSARFAELIQVLLGDNGSEFSNPLEIEFNAEGNRRTRVFYCDPQASYQKPRVENNHTFIRRIIPKGKSMDPYNQSDIQLMMDHINSYSRASLGNISPYEAFSKLYGEDILKALGAKLIPSNEIILRPSLLEK